MLNHPIQGTTFEFIKKIGYDPKLTLLFIISDLVTG